MSRAVFAKCKKLVVDQKVAVDTSAGTLAWLEIASHGTELSSHRHVQFRTATGEIVDNGHDY